MKKKKRNDMRWKMEKRVWRKLKNKQEGRGRR
jgi:hypothetical protein